MDKVEDEDRVNHCMGMTLRMMLSNKLMLRMRMRMRLRLRLFVVQERQTLLDFIRTLSFWKITR